MKLILVLFLVLGFSASSLGEVADAIAATAKYVQCWQDPVRQQLRSNELQDIVAMDQADRMKGPIDWNVVGPRDDVRIQRVGEIFAEGCFHSAADYAAAALVFQHGSVADHYYQAFLWSKKAFELGDLTQNQMMANAIDRYLLNLGYKQLFGAQTFRSGHIGCHCLEKVEHRFSDRKRIRISGVLFASRVERLRVANEVNADCGKVLFCDRDLKTPPKGLFPGIW